MKKQTWKNPDTLVVLKLMGNEIIKFAKDFLEDLYEILRYKNKKLKEENQNYDDDEIKFFGC